MKNVHIEWGPVVMTKTTSKENAKLKLSDMSIIYIEDQDSFVYVKSLKSRKVGDFEIKDALIDQYENLSSNWIEV